MKFREIEDAGINDLGEKKFNIALAINCAKFWQPKKLN